MAGRSARSWRALHRLLKKPDAVLGFKTGYTAESGYNLAVAAQSSGQRFFAVTLGSTSRAKSVADVLTLLRHALPVSHR